MDPILRKPEIQHYPNEMQNDANVRRKELSQIVRDQNRTTTGEKNPS